jgi:hypothetical protein
VSTTNAYCEALGIRVPRLEQARRSPDANTYSLLLVALLERGEPITLVEAAKRFEQAGVAPADRALASLKKCKPARPPIYRDGELYALDPHDDEADLWAFRLGLRPPKGARLEPVRPDPPDPGPLPSPDRPLTAEALTEAWRDGVSSEWSAQRIAVCVLDAHGGAMRPEDVLAFVRARTRWSLLSADSARYWRRGAPVRIRDDGRWEIDRGHAALRSARQAVRDRIAVIRRWAHARPDPAVVEASIRDFERRRRAHGDQLARMRRVLLYAFPARQPEALVLVDVGRREIATFMGVMGEKLGEVRERLAGYDVIAAIDVRALLRAIGFDPGARRLGEVGPPQKTRTLNRRGRKLRITTSLLVQGSCGISRPFGDAEVLRSYLRDGKHTQLRRRLEADAKSLFALYQFGRLHGAVRLRWGFLDEWIPAPWVHRDEPTLYDLMRQAHELRLPLETVAGDAPGWEDPWSRRQRVHVRKEEARWRYWLVDEAGFVVDAHEIQLARFADPDRTLM